MSFKNCQCINDLINTWISQHMYELKHGWFSKVTIIMNDLSPFTYENLRILLIQNYKFHTIFVKGMIWNFSIIKRKNVVTPNIS